MEKICGCPFFCGGSAKFLEGVTVAICAECGASVYDTTCEGRLEIMDELVVNGVASMEIAFIVDYCNRKKVPRSKGGAAIFGVRNMQLQ